MKFAKFTSLRPALGAVLLAFAAGTASAQAPEKFTFALNWFAVGDHAAYWVALDKGYFTKAGLDVTLENSKGSGDSIAKVDTGRADAGLADAAVVIASTARGTTVKTVSMVFDKVHIRNKNDAVRWLLAFDQQNVTFRTCHRHTRFKFPYGTPQLAECFADVNRNIVFKLGSVGQFFTR